MKKRICDRCKKNINDFGMDRNIVHFTWEGTKDWEWIIGKKYEMDLCRECWYIFMDLTPKNK